VKSRYPIKTFCFCVKLTLQLLETILDLWVIDRGPWPAVPKVAILVCGFRALPDVPVDLVAEHGIMRINAYSVVQCWKEGQGAVGRLGGRRRGRGEQKVQQD
jgi:hypothetical protein